MNPFSQYIVKQMSTVPLIALEDTETALYELTSARKKKEKKRKEKKEDYKHFQKRPLKKKEKRARQKSIMVVLLRSKMVTFSTD